MVDVGVVQEVVRHAICLSNTTFNVSEWIGRSEDEGIPIQRTMSHESRSTDVAGSAPSSPRPTQQQQKQQQQHHQQQHHHQQHHQQHAPEVFEAKEVAQQQHSAVRFMYCGYCK